MEELQKYIAVDIFGKCGESCSDKCEDVIISEYLFYLAFENQVCNDYITEKFWRMGTGSGIVPIVLKGKICNFKIG